MRSQELLSYILFIAILTFLLILVLNYYDYVVELSLKPQFLTFYILQDDNASKKIMTNINKSNDSKYRLKQITNL